VAAGFARPARIPETVIDLFPTNYVYTQRDVQFPVGSTPVDFAYSIHTQIGHQCVGAKINSKIVPLRYQLKNGDIVEIITAPGHQPSKDWLKFVQTSRARTKIRQWIKAQTRERSVDLGKEICEREFKKYHLDFGKIIKTEEMKRSSVNYLSILDDLMVESAAAIFPSRLSPSSSSRKLQKEKGRVSPQAPSQNYAEN
jgi:GTP pyrophosphokinase